MPKNPKEDELNTSHEESGEPETKKVKTEPDATNLGEFGSRGEQAVVDDEQKLKDISSKEKMRELAASAAERRLKKTQNRSVVKTKVKTQRGRKKAVDTAEEDEVVEGVVKRKTVTTETVIEVIKKTTVKTTIKTRTVTDEERTKIEPVKIERVVPLVVEEPAPSPNDPNASPLRSPIRMISNKEYCEKYCPSGDKDAVTMTDLVGSALLKKTYQFNYLIDCSFLLPYIAADPSKVDIVLVGGSLQPNLDKKLKENFRIKIIGASKRLGSWGSHHSKMMVNFFVDDTCQIVIHTMNLTETDYKIQTQMCWMSPRLKLAKEDQRMTYTKYDLDVVEEVGDTFKRDLLAYFRSYQEPVLAELLTELEMFDFTPIDVQFVGSSPGYYKVDTNDMDYPEDSGHTFGYGKLYQVLRMHELGCMYGDMVAQVSAIASPFDSKQSNIFVHLLTSIAEGSWEYKTPAQVSGLNPIIVWPTIDEIKQSHTGRRSGEALHMRTRSSGRWNGYERQWDRICHFFHRWSSPEYSGDNSKESKAGRSRLTPHVKTYCVSADHFKTLEWFLLSSANVSSQAWGKPGKRKNCKPWDYFDYEISSYEAGVLISPKTAGKSLRQPGEKYVPLVPVFGTDTLPKSDVLQCPVRMPYDLPVYKYTEADDPWTSNKY